MTKPYGHELILDIHNCNSTKFTEDLVKQFCKQICEIINMEPEDFHIWASDPEDFETDPPHLHGVSAIQFITTSSIVVHTITKMEQVYINIFSCKSFEHLKATAFTQKFFQGDVINSNFLTRF